MTPQEVPPGRPRRRESRVAAAPPALPGRPVKRVGRHKSRDYCPACGRKRSVCVCDLGREPRS